MLTLTEVTGGRDPLSNKQLNSYGQKSSVPINWLTELFFSLIQFENLIEYPQVKVISFTPV